MKQQFGACKELVNSMPHESNPSRRVMCVALTLEGVQGFAGANGGQRLLVVKLVVKLRRPRGGVDCGFDLNLWVLLLCVAAIRAAQGSTHTHTQTHKTPKVCFENTNSHISKFRPVTLVCVFLVFFLVCHTSLCPARSCCSPSSLLSCCSGSHRGHFFCVCHSWTASVPPPPLTSPETLFILNMF